MEHLLLSLCLSSFSKSAGSVVPSPMLQNWLRSASAISFLA